MSIRKAQEKADKYGVIITKSHRKHKRFAAHLPDGRTVHFGQEGGKTFLDHGDTNIRRAWRARHSKIYKTVEGELIPSYKVKYTPEWFSWRILW